MKKIRKIITMKHEVLFSLDIPSGLMAFLSKVSKLDDFEIRDVLGVSLQQVRDFREGRQSLSPFKADRLANMVGLSNEGLASFVSQAQNPSLVSGMKTGDKVVHPFRGPAEIHEIRGLLSDIFLSKQERYMRGVPLIVFREKDLEKIMEDVRQISSAPESKPKDEDTGASDPVIAPVSQRKKPTAFSRFINAHPVESPPSQEKAEVQEEPAVQEDPLTLELPQDDPQGNPELHEKGPEEPVILEVHQEAPSMIAEFHDEKPMTSEDVTMATQAEEAYQASVTALIAKAAAKGLSHKGIGDAIGISRSMVGFYNVGRNRMPEDRFEKLSAYLEGLDGSEEEAPKEKLLSVDTEDLSELLDLDMIASDLKKTDQPEESSPSAGMGGVEDLTSQMEKMTSLMREMQDQLKAQAALLEALSRKLDRTESPSCAVDRLLHLMAPRHAEPGTGIEKT